MICVEASYIKWHGDYEKALILAKKQNKPMLIYLQKKDCNDCTKMLKGTLYNQSYIEYINDTYISVIVSYEHKTSYPIELFYSSTFPALFFISQKDELFLVEPILGYIKPKKFNSILKLLTITN